MPSIQAKHQRGCASGKVWTTFASVRSSGCSCSQGPMSYEVDLDVFERIVGAARREGQPGLAALRVEGSADLEPAVARQLAAELAQLRASAVLLDLDPVLVALAEVANWCARSREKAWLRISAG